VAIWLVDRVGRRVLLLTGLAGMGVSLCMLALGFLLGTGPALRWLTAASLAAYVGSFAIGLGPVFWLLISEIFPLAIRGRGMSAATIANWLANLVVALTFLDLVDLLGRPGVFFVYAALAFGALLFARALVPETKGLSLEAVEALWVGRVSDKRPTIAPAKPVARK
jgi:MFS family permease